MISIAGKIFEMARGAPLSIFMYHAVIKRPLSLPDYCFISVEEFAAQMDWLTEQAVQVMPLVEAVAALEDGRLIEPTVAITFDDGYRNNVEVALPVLEKHGFPATIFLSTGMVGSPRALWPSRLNLALTSTQCHEISWRGINVSLSDINDKANALRRLQEAVKKTSGADPAAAVLEIEHMLQVPVDPLVPWDSPFAMMDSVEVMRAKESGLFEFGAHTVTHPILSQLDDASLESEIGRSLDAVEKMTGQQCRCFAYPNGHKVDFDSRATQYLMDRDVNVAVTSDAGPNLRGVDPLRLSRYGVGPVMNSLRFAAAAYGLPLEPLSAALRRMRGSFARCL